VIARLDAVHSVNEHGSVAEFEHERVVGDFA
jgi:hypothetical protein